MAAMFPSVGPLGSITKEHQRAENSPEGAHGLNAIQGTPDYVLCQASPAGPLPPGREAKCKGRLRQDPTSQAL